MGINCIAIIKVINSVHNNQITMYIHVTEKKKTRLSETQFSYTKYTMFSYTMHFICDLSLTHKPSNFITSSLNIINVSLHT